MRISTAIVFCALIFLMGCVLNKLPPVQGKYCDMVQIHKETNGQYGWAPYKQTEQCK